MLNGIIVNFTQKQNEYVGGKEKPKAFHHTNTLGTYNITRNQYELH